MSLGVLLSYVNGKLVSTFEIQYPTLVLCTHLRIAAFTTFNVVPYILCLHALHPSYVSHSTTIR